MASLGVVALLAAAGYAAIAIQAIVTSPGALERLYTLHPVAASLAITVAVSGIVTAQAAHGPGVNGSKHKVQEGVGAQR